MVLEKDRPFGELRAFRSAPLLVIRLHLNGVVPGILIIQREAVDDLQLMVVENVDAAVSAILTRRIATGLQRQNELDMPLEGT